MRSNKTANGDSPGVMRLSKQCRYYRESVPAFRDGAVIAITNRSASMLGQECDVALGLSADDSPLSGEHAATRLAQLSIVDALFLAVAQRNRAPTEINLGRTMRAQRAQRDSW